MSSGDRFLPIKYTQRLIEAKGMKIGILLICRIIRETCECFCWGGKEERSKHLGSQSEVSGETDKASQKWSICFLNHQSMLLEIFEPNLNPSCFMKALWFSNDPLKKGAVSLPHSFWFCTEKQKDGFFSFSFFLSSPPPSSSPSVNSNPVWNSRDRQALSFCR